MMAGRCLQKLVYSIDIFLVMMVVMVHDSLGGFGGSARLPHCLEQGAPKISFDRKKGADVSPHVRKSCSFK